MKLQLLNAYANKHFFSAEDINEFISDNLEDEENPIITAELQLYPEVEKEDRYQVALDLTSDESVLECYKKLFSQIPNDVDLDKATLTVNFKELEDEETSCPVGELAIMFVDMHAALGSGRHKYVGYIINFENIPVGGFNHPKFHLIQEFWHYSESDRDSSRVSCSVGLDD